MVNVNNGTISRWAKKYSWNREISLENWHNGQAYSEQTINKARELYEQGLPKKMILENLGMKWQSTLDHWIKKYSWRKI